MPRLGKVRWVIHYLVSFDRTLSPMCISRDWTGLTVDGREDQLGSSEIDRKRDDDIPDDRQPSNDPRDYRSVLGRRKHE